MSLDDEDRERDHERERNMMDLLVAHGRQSVVLGELLERVTELVLERREGGRQREERPPEGAIRELIEALAARQPPPSASVSDPAIPQASADEAAVLTQYDQLRAGLGRKGARFYVVVDRDPEYRVRITGEMAGLPDTIRIGKLETRASEWVHDTTQGVWTSHRTDVNELEDGVAAECCAGERIVAVGVWRVPSGTRKPRTASSASSRSSAFSIS